MKLLYRYLAGQLFPPLVVGAIMLSFVLILSGLFDVIELIFSIGVGAASAFKIFLCFFPHVLILTTPISFLLACLLTYGRLSEEHEIGAMRAGGFRFMDLVVPAVALAFMVSLLLLWWTSTVSPAAWRVQESILMNIINKTSFIQIFPEGRFNGNLGGDLGGGIVFRIRQVERDEQKLRGVVVFKMDKKQEQKIDSIITAPEADVSYDADRYEVLLSLHKAVLHQSQEVAGGETKPASYTIAGFGTLQLRIPIGDWVLRRIPVHSLGRMSNRDLKQEMESVRKGEIHYEKWTPEERIRNLQRELAHRNALAFCPIALALVGVPVGLTMRTGRKSAAFIICLIILSLYYGLFAVAKSLAEASGALPPHLLLQAPNLLLIIGGLLACRWMSRS